MTREEHIENLKAIASDMPSDKCSDWIESLMAGVKALEQEPKTDVLDKIKDEIVEQYERVPLYDIPCDVGLKMVLGIIDKYIAEGSKE